MSNKLPVASYGPYLLAALIKGSKEELVIELPSWREAWHLMQRMYSLRRRAEEQKHEAAPLIVKAKMRITWDEERYPAYLGAQRYKRPRDTSAPAKLHIYPRDENFTSAFQSAGVELDTASPDGGAERPSGPDPGDLYLEKLFGKEKMK